VKTKFNLTGVRFKILMPMLAIIIVTTVGLGIFSYVSQKQTLTKLLEQTTDLKVQDIKSQISESQNTVMIFEIAINKYLIDITKGVAESLAGVQDDKLNEEAVRLAKSLDVDEIHITDENGVLKWGNVPEVFGFDFNSSDQTKPFLKGLTDKEFTMAQPAQPRGADGKLFKYVTVARIESPV
jgi:methyl-accepting chemotaxis protein